MFYKDFGLNELTNKRNNFKKFLRNETYLVRKMFKPLKEGSCYFGPAFLMLKFILK